MRASSLGFDQWKVRRVAENGSRPRSALTPPTETIVVPDQVAFVRESNLVLVLSAIFVFANVVTSAVYLARYL